MSAAQAGQSWVNGRFSMRSGFYAGRAPSTGDLNVVILEMFYQGILKDVGQEAASNFVRFVNNLNDLSASAFIIAFESFWNSGCKITKVEQHSSDRYTLSGRGDDLLAEGFGLIGAVLGGREMGADETIDASIPIKEPFLRNHSREIPDGERSKPRPRQYRSIFG